MAAVEVTITGVLYDKINRTAQNVVLIGEASYTGLGVGGGPVIPPGGPVHIWGGGNVPMPSPPIYFPPQWGGERPPHIWGGGNEPFPTPPIFIPPNVPPGITPPEPPQPGAPTEPLQPPAGSAGWPVNPIVTPPYVVIWYPGIGPVVVAPPAQSGGGGGNGGDEQK